MGFTETRLGIIPATIALNVLARNGRRGGPRPRVLSARLFDEAEGNLIWGCSLARCHGELDGGDRGRGCALSVGCAPGAVAAASNLRGIWGRRIERSGPWSTYNRGTGGPLLETEEAAEGNRRLFFDNARRRGSRGDPG